MLEQILSGQSLLTGSLLTGSLITGRLITGRLISKNGSCGSTQNYSSTPNYRASHNYRASYAFLLKSFHFSLSSFLPSQIVLAHFSRNSVVNGALGDSISEIGISNMARNSSGEDDLQMLRKEPRLQKNKTMNPSSLSKEPSTTYNLFHTHQGANSHD